MPVVTLQFLTRFALVLGCLPGALSLGRLPLQAAPAVAVPMSPPQPSLSSTPIDFFRQLLAANPGERERLLTGKSPEHRKVLESSVRVYEGLSPEERELRLRTLEFRYRLTSLLRTPSGLRAERLKTVPEKERPILEERLQLWNTLAVDDQKWILESERRIRIFLGANLSTFRSDLPISGQASNQLRQIELELIRWQTVPEGRRAKLQSTFSRLFDPPQPEAAKNPLLPPGLPADELRKMQATLEQFKNLEPAQRAQCIRNFARFAELSPADRRRLLADAQEWERMNPEDRATFRKLVQRIPPLPPRLTPLPPRLLPTARTQRLATDTNL